MKIACVGAGPAGLYLAILMKKQDPANEITVYERNPPEVTYGWGVVFWGDLVEDLEEGDPETASEIVAQSFAWTGNVLDVKGKARIHADGTGFSIRRQRLLDILARRAQALGVKLVYGHDISDASHIPVADLVVASDGGGSVMRRLRADALKPQVEVGRNKYVWLGTTRVFDAFTFGFVPTKAGWVWFHAYAFESGMSTLIVECAPETWAGLGLDTMGGEESLALLESLFAQHLLGHRLTGQLRPDGTLPWVNFRTLTNDVWHAGNVVLVGDAAHTTHFAIGSGTRLAIQDLIALARNLHGAENLEAALAAYGAERQSSLLKPQRDARLSAQWFENVPRYMHLNSTQLFALLQDRRSRLIPRMPPRVYYHLHKAMNDVSALRRLRSWAARRGEGANVGA